MHCQLEEAQTWESATVGGWRAQEEKASDERYRAVSHLCHTNCLAGSPSRPPVHRDFRTQVARRPPRSIPADAVDEGLPLLPNAFKRSRFGEVYGPERMGIIGSASGASSVGSASQRQVVRFR